MKYAFTVFLFSLGFILIHGNVFAQASQGEVFDYKYAYHGKGKYYIHALEVKREVFERYLHKCDSVLRVSGQHKNMAYETVPEVQIVSEMAFYPGNVNFWGSGLNFSMPINGLLKEEKAIFWLKRFSLNWKVLAGNNNSNDFFFHSNAATTPMSRIPLGTTTESSGNSIGVDLLILISAFVPEGISYHIPINEQFRITAFLNPLGGDYWKNAKNNYGGGTTAMDFGIKPAFVTSNKFTLGATLGYKIIYTDSYDRGPYAGISIGLQLY